MINLARDTQEIQLLPGVDAFNDDHFLGIKSHVPASTIAMPGFIPLSEQKVVPLLVSKPTMLVVPNVADLVVIVNDCLPISLPRGINMTRIEVDSLGNLSYIFFNVLTSAIMTTEQVCSELGIGSIMDAQIISCRPVDSALPCLPFVNDVRMGDLFGKNRSSINILLLASSCTNINQRWITSRTTSEKNIHSASSGVQWMMWKAYAIIKIHKHRIPFTREEFRSSFIPVHIGKIKAGAIPPHPSHDWSSSSLFAAMSTQETPSSMSLLAYLHKRKRETEPEPELEPEPKLSDSKKKKKKKKKKTKKSVRFAEDGEDNDDCNDRH